MLKKAIKIFNGFFLSGYNVETILTNDSNSYWHNGIIYSNLTPIRKRYKIRSNSQIIGVSINEKYRYEIKNKTLKT